jgi:hypothetical protein
MMEKGEGAQKAQDRTQEAQKSISRISFLCLLCSLCAFCVPPLLLCAAANQILCSLGPGTSNYNTYSDERPTPDAMELAGKVNGGLGAICRPNCPTMSMFRNTSAPNLMLVVASGQAKIVYKPEFFTTVYETYGDGGILALIAHEVGHAMDANGAAKWMKPAWSPELRADAWAGCAFSRVSLSAGELRAGLSALKKFPSPAHPDWAVRGPVLRAGYMECGGDVSKWDK